MSVVYGKVSQNITKLSEVIQASRSSFPKATPGSYWVHTQEYYEIFCLVQGHAEFLVEGTWHPLAQGDIVFVRKGEAHMIRYKDYEPYERIIIHFKEEALPDLGDIKEKVAGLFYGWQPGHCNHFSAAQFHDSNWFYYLNRMITEDDTIQQLYLTVLLSELTEAAPRLEQEETAVVSGPVNIAIAYIAEHLTEKLDLNQICRQTFLSRTQINRLFRKSTGHTVWEYITMKRMHMARELLQRGETPTRVCGQTGFGDYCSFYRAYKKYFGVSPSTDRGKPGFLRRTPPAK